MWFVCMYLHIHKNIYIYIYITTVYIYIYVCVQIKLKYKQEQKSRDTLLGTNKKPLKWQFWVDDFPAFQRWGYGFVSCHPSWPVPPWRHLVAETVLAIKASTVLAMPCSCCSNGNSSTYRRRIRLMVLTSWGEGSWNPHDFQGYIHPKWLFGISEPSTVSSDCIKTEVKVCCEEYPPWNKTAKTPENWRLEDGFLLFSF